MGCSDWLYRCFDLWGVFVRGMYLYGAVCCVFVRRFVLLCVLLFGGMLCAAVMCCLCGLLFVVVCNASLAVLLFGCMYVCVLVVMFCCW